jgi:hypothetical protein
MFMLGFFLGGLAFSFGWFGGRPLLHRFDISHADVLQLRLNSFFVDCSAIELNPHNAGGRDSSFEHSGDLSRSGLDRAGLAGVHRLRLE